jgi:DNA-binding NtrC family response regulator
LTCENSLDSGASFRIRLPAAHIPVGERVVPTTMVNSSAILVVDDEGDILTVVGDYLRAHGRDVTLARTGTQALEALRKRSYGALVIDFLMPGMTGAEVFQQAVSLDPSYAKRTILLTGAGQSKAVREFARRAGCPIVEKPISLETLQTRIADILG